MVQEWSYRQLAEAYREEKGSNVLTTLPADFDLSLSGLLQFLESASKNGGEGAKELDNARRQAMSLLRLRREKIVRRALLVEGTQEANQEPAGMTEGEHALYDRVHNLTEKEEERLAHILLPKSSGNMMASGASGNGLSAGAGGLSNGAAGLANGAGAGSSFMRRVQVLKDVPAYRGADGVNYGPYSAGQQAELPEGEAQWMLKGGMASESGL